MKSPFLSMVFFLSLGLILSGCEPAGADGSGSEMGADSLVVAEKPVSVEVAESVEEDSVAVFQVEYEKWYKRVTTSGEFCTLDQCAEAREAFERDDEWESACFIAVPERPEYLIGDLNGDGLADAVADADWTQCDGGNALHTARTWLVFLSQADGSYRTIDNPEVFASLGIGSVYKIGGGVIFGEGLDYHEDDPRCCPSISWDVEYGVVDGKIVETKMSEKVREEME